MTRKPLSIAYSKDLKPVKLTQERLDRLAAFERQELERSREKSKPSKLQVQMSIRMEEGAYLLFRALCRAQGKTNGDMVQKMMRAYLSDA